MEIGLVDIGGNLAAWLAQQGHTVTGFDINAEATARAAARGVTPVGSRTELALHAEVIATSLADLEAVRATYFADDGLIALAGRDTVTVECSTLPLDLARQITAARQETGGAAIEAPMIGIGKDATAGRLFLMAAGAALPVLNAMVETYRRDLAAATIGAPGILTRHAQKTLAEALSR